MKPIFVTFMLAVVSLSGIAAANDSIDYRPNIHGTVRARFEYATSTDEYRFQVRNARLSVDGKIMKEISYFINTDLCDRGKMKILDAWARAEFAPSLSLQAGQFRMPFGIDPFRAPHQYYFANRSFIGKQMCNYRAVGAMLIYDIPAFPLKIEAGAFNPYTIGDHTPWSRKLAAAGKVTYSHSGIRLSTGVSTIRPHNIRANLLGACAGWENGRWTVEAEYMHKHYVNKARKAAHAYSVFANWWMPVKAGIFNRLSFQGRFDGLTDHSDTAPDENGAIATTDPARNRLTGGATLTYFRKKNMFFDFRVNYEKYFYHKDFTPTAEAGDKLVAELVLRF